MKTESENVLKDAVSGMQSLVTAEQTVNGVEPGTNEPTLETVEALPNGVYEIAPGMTSEQIRAEFFNEDALQEQPETVFRLDSSGHRYYYTFDENGDPRFYVSVTTLIKQTLPTSPSLIKWIADMGYDETQRYAAERASYGTFMHAQIAELIINRSYDLNKLKERLKLYIESEKLPSDFINYSDDFKKDILAFAQFMKDVDLKPLAIELVLTNPEDGYAGAIDLAAEITIEEKGFFGEVYKTGANAGKPKETKKQRRIRAIIDFKSGRKGFFPEYEVQLHAYMKMWNMHFEAYPIEKVFNWSPKDWRGTTPSYNFKDQTESKNALKLPYLVELAKIEDEKRDNTIVSCTGVIDIDNPTGLDDNIIELSLAEVVKKRKQSEPEPPKQAIIMDPADESGNTEIAQKHPEIAQKHPEIAQKHPEIAQKEDISIQSKQEPEQIKQMTCCEFEIEINDIAPYSLWEVTDIAKANGVELVESGLNLDQHRWYSIATNIYKCSDGYVKVTGAYQSFSESQTWEDINVCAEAEKLQGKELKAFELRMKAYEIENEPEPAQEPKEEPKKESAKTTKGKKKASDGKSKEEVATVAAEEESVAEAKKEKNKLSKKALLNCPNKF